MTRLFSCSLILLFVFASCSRDLIEPRDYNEPYFKALTVEFPTDKFLVDAFRDLLYIFDWDSKEWIIYNYESKEIVLRKERPVHVGEFFWANYFTPQTSDFVFSGRSTLVVLDGITLEEKKRKILELPFPNPYAPFTSISIPNEHCIILGATYGTSELDAHQAFFYDKKSNELKGETFARSRFKKLVAYMNSDGTIGINQVSDEGIRPNLYYDEFSEEGDLIYSFQKQHAEGDFSRDLLVTNAAADYFITGKLGRIYDKKSLEHLYSLSDSKLYSHILLHENADTLYGVSDNQLEIIEYTTKEVLRVEALERNPTGVFKDGRQLIFVFRVQQPSGDYEICISKIDLW